MSEPQANNRLPHTSVLYQAILRALEPRSPGHYIDATLGAGGHAWGILDASAPLGELLGLDVDPRALELASQRLFVYGQRATLVQASYTTLLLQMQHLGWPHVDGVVLDLGVSSMQIDTPDRGFSFLQDGPLDMRFDPRQSRSAADLVNGLPEDDLSKIIWQYGEDPHSRRIARSICQARPLYTTHQLAEVISRASGGRRERIHPATRTFQAIRIAVNEELQSLEAVLPQAVQALGSGGRLAVISFHSLEDRLVKQFMRRESRDCICPPEVPVCICGHQASIIEITRHPIMADESEIEQNPRARSAKLRVAEKL